MALTSPIEKFLDSIPDLSRKQKQLSQSSDLDGARESIRNTIRSAVKSRLARRDSDGDEGWISELIGLCDAKDDVEFVTSFLTDYVIEKPWIISEAVLRYGADMERVVYEKKIKLESGNFCGPRGHSGCQNLSQLLRCHNGHNASLETVGLNRTWGFMLPDIRAERNELSNSRDGLSEDLSFQVDSLLGLAGFLPLLELYQASARELPLPAQDLRYLQEFRTHICIENKAIAASMEYHARVSFLDYKEVEFESLHSEASLDSATSRATNLVLRIRAAIGRLKAALRICQAKGRCLSGVPFLRRESPKSRRQTISTEIIPTLMMENFFSAFDNMAESFTSLLRTNQPEKALEELGWNARRRDTPGVLDWIVAAAGTIPAILLWRFPLIPSALVRAEVGAVGAVAGVGAARLAQARPDTSLSNLMACLSLILERFGIDFKVSMLDNTTLLHLSALAIQALCLAVQSGVRGSCSPIGSSFLEHDLNQIILDGANTDTGPKIVASACSLTCFGDLLGKEVLVFGEQLLGPVAPKSFDLVSSVQEVLSLWGPGKLLVTEISSTKDDKQFTVSGVEIGGGMLRPVRSEFEPAIAQWHWSKHNKGAMDADEYCSRTIIDLDTKIQIGASSGSAVSAILEPQTESPLHDRYSAVHFPGATSPNQFNPVGPCRQNSQCAHANTHADIARRQKMATSLKDIGTHESYTELAGFEVGGQAGYYLTGHAVTTWERRPAIPVKRVQITENQSPQEVLTIMGKIHGLFISNCTDVMARARIRDVVALFGPILHRDKFPTLEGHSSSEESIPVLVEALQGPQNFSEWASKVFDSDNRPLDQSSKLKDLALAVLRTLEYTGIRPNGCFEAAWVSPHQEKASVRALCRTNRWLYCLSESEHISTFACVTPFCLEVPGYLCVNSPQPKCSLMRGLGHFALSTRLLAFEVLPQSVYPKNNEQKGSLRLKRKYLINSRALGIVATVMREQRNFDNGHYYELEVAKSHLGEILKRVILKEKAQLLRESNDLLAKPCIIKAQGSS